MSINKESESMQSPCAEPIDSLEDLLRWQGTDDYYTGVAPLEPCQRDENMPKTLVCHDMAGGYLEDRFVQGSDKYDAYRFYHWHLVDTFVYFSHHLITIAPPCWINAAHKHGVPVLGTFITEWQDGYEKCSAMLSDTELMDRVVNQMVDIAVHHSMDGWLINIENEIEFDQIPALIVFVRLLTDRMHQANPASQVIWYDSVTIAGKLEWQNELNELNSVFFEQCDAIFLNYTWTTENLLNSAKNSHGRLHDVYVGLDVFGRGMIGGGGFNTKEALALARKAQLSIALFAPGWVYETNGTREFDANEESVFRFWYYLQPYLPMHVSCSLPLSTTFCQGWGKRLYADGKAISSEPWSNLSMQQLQPTLTHSEMGHNPHQQFKWLHLDDGFLGGGSLRCVGRLPNTGKALTYRIFDTAIELDESIYVKYTIRRTKSQMEDSTKLFLYIILNKDDMENEERLLLPEDEFMSSYIPENDTDSYIEPLPMDMVPEALLSSTRDTNWQNRVFWISSDLVEGKSLDEIGLMAYTEDITPRMLDVLVGSIQVISSDDATLEPVPVSNVCCDDIKYTTPRISESISERVAAGDDSEDRDIERLVSMKLTWNEPEIAADVTAYHIWYSLDGGEKTWLGCTYSNKFYISSLPLGNASLSCHATTLFNIQVQYKSGVIQSLDHSAEYIHTH